jgi:UDP-glucose 4-epimerase
MPASLSTVVVFGGAGFAGSHVAGELFQYGHLVKIFSRRKPRVELPDVPVLIGDFARKEDIAAALKDCDVAVHAVSSSLPANSNQDPVFDVEANLVATIRFLEEVRRQNVKRVILISSGGTIYGRNPFPSSESDLTFPLCSYGIVKLAIEKYLFMYSQLYGIAHTIVRLGNPYGERQVPAKGQGVIASFLSKIACGVPVEVWGDGSVVRDYIYILDAVRAIRLLLESPVAEGIFNVGTGVGTSLDDLLKCIERTTGETMGLKRLPGRALDVPVSILNVDKLRQATGWTPIFDLPEGIRRTWEWHKKSQ